MIDYNNKKFRPISTSDNGEVDTEMIFHYKQSGNVLTCDYAGGSIKKGNLMGIVLDDVIAGGISAILLRLLLLYV